MKSRISVYLSMVAALGFLAVSGCSEAPTVAPDSTNELADGHGTFSKAPDCSADPSHPKCSDDGGGSDPGGGRVDMYANLIPSSPLHANEVVDQSGSGGRLGTGWTTGFGLEWNGSEFVVDPDGDDAFPEPGANCPPGLKFGLLEGNMKGGYVASIWLRGYTNGVQYSSKKIDVGRQEPKDTGWTLDIQRDIDLYEGNGSGNGSVECTVYVNIVDFVPVNP